MIDFINVKKSFADKDILRDATFRINKGEHVGLVGPNGAGKSTIFNMVIGDTEQDKGEILLPKNMRLGYLKQQLKSDENSETLIDYTADAMPELRELHHKIEKVEQEIIAESSETKLNLLGELQSKFESLGGYEMRAKAEAALSGLGFHTDEFSRPLKSFSGGWQMRAGLAQTLILDPDILLLDEPSNYLDIPAIEWMQRYLKNFKGTILLISHDRYLLNSLTNVTIEVNAGLVNRYAGDYDYYVRERENRYQSLQAAKENQDKRIEQLESSINRFRAKSTKAAQVQSWIKTLEKMERIEVPDSLSYSGTIKIPKPPSSGAEMMRLEEIGHTYDSDKWILKGIDQRIERGDKIGIIGYNGMGKSTLLRIIAGQMPQSEGKRILGHKVVLGYQAQEFAEILPMEKSIHNIISNAAPDGSTDKDIRNVLASFGFQGEAVHKQCQVLSGGEKIRLAFARIFINPPNFLILDEPTTHLDIAAREGLQQAIKNYEGTVCIVSHDVEFIKCTATSILAMDGNKGVKKYFGDYNYYRSKLSQDSNQSNELPKKKTEESPKVIENPKEERKRKAEMRKKMQGKKKSLEKAVSKLESEMEKWEEEKAELMETLAANAPDTDFAALNKQLKNLDYSISIATVDWEEKAEELEIFLEEYNAI